MLLVFMNSSARVWEALRSAIEEAGFVIVKADVFDKQHGTFKHFVSENRHCLKPNRAKPKREQRKAGSSLDQFLACVDADRYLQHFLHVGRPTELDLRRLYSEWVAEAVVDRLEVTNPV
jgi:hypothetical protein